MTASFSPATSKSGDAVSSILVLGSTATLVMTIGDITQVYVQGKVDEADIGKVYLGQPARIKVESFRDKIFNGKVTRSLRSGSKRTTSPPLKSASRSTIRPASSRPT